MSSSYWNNFLPFLSANYTQKFLYKKYLSLQIIDAEPKSYQNCYPFIYYIEHAKIYFDQAQNASLVIKPILIFYGFTHLLKACILTIDPNYPGSTSVLAHGVSTRKRKKQQYEFFYDEVKIQKTGLFPLISEKMFHMKHLEGEKFVMKDLLESTPELFSLFSQLNVYQPLIPLKKDNKTLLLPNNILDIFHMTKDRFIQYFNESYASIPIDENFALSITNFSSLKNTPIRFDFIQEQYFFFANKEKTLLPEILSHYLILYNLSMISRYETEWWSELLKTMPTNDYPFIYLFCQIAIEKELFLISSFLYS